MLPAYCCTWHMNDTLMKVYEQNIHETMKAMPAQRDRRKEDYKRVLTLFDSDSHARERRNKARTSSTRDFAA